MAKKSDKKIFDGMDPLIRKLQQDGLIKLAIENSYFFSVDIVKKRQSELATLFQNKNQIPARKTTKKDSGASDYAQEEKNGTFYYCEQKNGVRIPIEVDKDGNRKVRSLINSYVGYWAGNGKDNSNFVNYTISHIWGRAFDPRYFTSLWNIVLVPSWANTLMDKVPTNGSIESKLQSTIKKICSVLYEDVEKGMGEHKPKMDINENDVVKGPYQINVLQEKNGKERRTTKTENYNINNISHEPH